MTPAPFSKASALKQTDPGRFRADVHPEWTIGGKPNGGYLLAIMGRAATTSGAHPHVIAASAHYLASPEPGPVVVETEVLRGGRSASQIRARMSQERTPCVEAILTTGTLRSSATAYWADGLPGRGATAYADCARLVPHLPNGARVAIMDQVEVRLDPAFDGFARGQPSGRGELRGWLALPDGEDFDHDSLLFAVDAFPPGTFDLEFAGWVPTFELTVYVRALPAPGPLRVLQRAQMIADHRVDEACFVWDGHGHLVAQGTQLAGIRLG